MSNISIERLENFIRSPLENGLTRGEQMEISRELLEYRNASKEAVAIVELNDNLTVAEIRGDIPRRKAVCELYEGALVIGQKLYATPQAESDVKLPAGWIAVPIAPTMEMLDEFDSIIDYGAEDSEDAWRRLITAAPKP